MKVGSRGDYGVRALVFLASQSDPGEPVQIHVIATHQQIPEDYLRQLLVNLRLAGLVRSVRGPHGGYVLAKPASDITMGEIIDVLEGAPEDMKCSHVSMETERCSIFAACNIRDKWRDAVAAMQRVLHETTLADLAAEKALR